MKILLIVGFITSYCSLFSQSAIVEGQRISTVFKYKFRSLTFNLKLAQTLYYNYTPINSGSVEGNTWTEIKLALKWVL